MLPHVVHKYLIEALAGTPDVAERLLQDLRVDDEAWDFRPDASRFTLREAVAHMADWEPIHLARLSRMLEEVNPVMADIDEGKMAIDNDYAHSDPHGSLEWLRGGRSKLVKQLKALANDDWSRPGVREAVGAITVEGLATFIAAHDGYHTRQIAQWLALSDAARTRT